MHLDLLERLARPVLNRWSEKRMPSRATVFRDGGGERCVPVANMSNLTFDMSGGPKGAKRPLERPLDGRVRALAAEALGVAHLAAQ